MSAGLERACREARNRNIEEYKRRNRMTIQEREEQLDDLLRKDLISWEEYANLWIDAQQDEETYPDGDSR